MDIINTTNSESNIYDIAIVGSGPAGFSASIYASRYKLSNIVFGNIPGGTITDAHKVCNYPGMHNISGLELGNKLLEQAKDLGGIYSSEHITDIKKKDNVFELTTNSNNIYYSKTIIFALGTIRNTLNLKNEDKYLGKGLSYCATCDAMFNKEKTVAVVGGSNAATMAASLLSEVAKKVYIIYRGIELRGDQVWIEEVKSKDNIEIIYTTVLTELQGEEYLKRVKLSKEYNGSEFLDVDSLFVEIGSVPNTDLSNKVGLKLDDNGYIEVLKDHSTNIEGIWAAGDCTNASNGFRQVVTAAAEGAIASNSVYKYIKGGSSTPVSY